MANYKLEDLTFTYPGSDVPALDGVDLDVRDGEFLLIVGPSGCGKSTLLRSLKSVLAPHGKCKGSVLYDGRPLEQVPDREQAAGIGFVFQHPDDHLVTDKVWHELAFGLESIGTERGRMRVRVAEMAGYFGLEGIFYRNVSELSGGQKQLVNLASVMALEPRVLILDEPTGQLDPIAAFDFLSTVKKLNTELGITVVLSEHRLEEALAFADRVAVMDRGRIVVCGEPKRAAASLFEQGAPMFEAMPSAVRISLGIGEKEPALTVNEGRRLLLSKGLEKKLVEVPERDAPRAEPVLCARELFFRYDKDGADVLKGLSLDVRPGEIFGLVGGNGAGKSTLLSVLSGELAPYRGRLELGGKKLKGKFSAFENRIGLLPQDPRLLFSSDTIRQELEKAAGRRGEKDAASRIDQVVSLMDISSVLERNPFDVSGGEQQRAAIAIILLTEPRIFLLDEPTKGMDASVKRALGEKLMKLRDEGLAVMLVTHDTEFCAEYADRAGFMFDGGVTAENTVRQFFSENTFYTTAANRIARDLYPNAILAREVTELAGKRE